MDPNHLPWGAIVLTLVKSLKAFGLIPGAIAAYWVKKLYQKWRQQKAMESWPAVEAVLLCGEVHQEGMRHWVEVTYTYFVDEYRSGTYVRHFRKAEDAGEFSRQVKDKRVRVHYSERNPDKSVILDRDMEMVVLLVPQIG